MKQFDKEWLLNKNKKSIFNYGYQPPEADRAVEDVIDLVEKEIQHLIDRKKNYVLRSRNVFNKLINEVVGMVLDKEMERWNNLLEVLKTQVNEIRMSEMMEDDARFNSGEYDIEEAPF